MLARLPTLFYFIVSADENLIIYLQTTYILTHVTKYSYKSYLISKTNQNMHMVTCITKYSFRVSERGMSRRQFHNPPS